MPRNECTIFLPLKNSFNKLGCGHANLYEFHIYYNYTIFKRRFRGGGRAHVRHIIFHGTYFILIKLH